MILLISQKWNLSKNKMADSDTPEALFQEHKNYITQQLSKGFTNDQLERWIVQLCDTLCTGKSFSFMIRFGQLVRTTAKHISLCNTDQFVGSKGEQMIIQALEFMNLQYIREFRVLNLLKERPNYQYELGWSFEIHGYCRYDFRIVSLGRYYGTLIEYDGGHHFTPVKYNEDDTDYMERFKTHQGPLPLDGPSFTKDHQNNDRLKRAIAIGLGYKMIRIHYKSPTENCNSMVGAITMAFKELESNLSIRCVCVVPERLNDNEYDYLEDQIAGMSLYKGQDTDHEINLNLDSLNLKEDLDLQESDVRIDSRPKWLSEIQVVLTWRDDQQLRTPVRKTPASDCRPNFNQSDPEHKICMDTISKLLGVDVLTDRTTQILDTVIKDQLPLWTELYPKIKEVFGLRFQNGTPSTFKAVKEMINCVLKRCLGCQLATVSKSKIQKNKHREWKYIYKIDLGLQTISTPSSI
jgi:hypothetical protein